jgi:RNA polymerase sigma-70 factor (ECF subfamily)
MPLTREQLDVLYRRHAPAAFRRARRLLGSDADAHEVVHDVFVALLADGDQYAQRSAPGTYLYAAVTNASLKRLRDSSNRARLTIERFATHGSQPLAAPVMSPERLMVLRSAIERMPEPLAYVAVYCYLDELTRDEIASVMGCSRRHVGNLLQRLDLWIRAEEDETCAS